MPASGPLHRTPCAALLAAALLAAGCGSGSDERAAGRPDATATPTARQDPAQVSLKVLRSFEQELVATLMLARDRAAAYEAGETATAQRLETQLNRAFKRVERYGSRARSALLDVIDSVHAEAAIQAADAWTEWAHENRIHPAAGNFERARELADLGARAIRDYQAAYQASGAQPPPAFRSR